MALLYFLGYLTFTVVGGVIVMVNLEKKTTLPRFVCAGFGLTVPLLLIFGTLALRDYLKTGLLSQDLIAQGVPVLIGFITAALFAVLHYAEKVWDRYVRR